MAHARFVVPGAALLALLLAGCTPESPTTTQSGGQSETPKVNVVRPERKTLRRIIEQPAHIEAFEETPLVARIAGQLDKVPCDIGDPIKGPRYDDKGGLIEPGTLLAAIAVPDMVQEHAEKKALVQQALAEVEQARALVATAQAQVASARALIREAEAGRTRTQASFERWESEYRRVEKLVKNKVIDEQARDEVRNQFKAAEAGRQEQDAKVATAEAAAQEAAAKEGKARADLEAAQAHVKVAEADEGRAAALLDFAQIRAPYDGVVTRRNMHTGHYVQPGTAALPLFVVSRTDKVRVLVDIPEADAPIVTDGMAAQVQVQAIKGRTFAGKVRRNSWSLDPKTHTLRVQIELPNPEGVVRPGMYALVTLTREFADRLALPASAVSLQGEQASAFLLEGTRVYRVAVKTGLREAGAVEILQFQRTRASGGNAPDWVEATDQNSFVREIVPGLADGREVQVVPARTE
jgi:HlyD family secretion protein